MPMSIFLLILAAAAILAPINATNTRKLSSTETSAGGSLDGQSKCGGCPCNKPCFAPPPPPPPRKPSPTPGLINCPPPPAYIYMTGPPGNLYPVDPYSRSSAHRRDVLVGQPLMVAVGLLGMLAFW